MSFCSIAGEGSSVRALPSIIAESILAENPIGFGDKASLLTTYRCGLCGRCSSCRYGLDVVEWSYRLRRRLLEKRLIPEPLYKMLQTIRGTKNSFGADLNARAMWIEYVGLKNIRLNKAADVVYFVGCTPSYRAQGQDVAYATALILNNINEDWSMLAADEWCCGAPLLAMGDWDSAEEHARHNVDFIESLGAKLVVSNCPSCVNMIKHHYPRLIGRRLYFDVQHVVELIDRRVSNGVLSGLEKTSMRVAYHDPCQLVRALGVYKEPRRILELMASKIIELPENGAETRCCGAGVADIIEVVDPAARLESAGRRLFQAGLVGADILVSACPDCKIALSDAARRVKSGIEVLEVVEMIAIQAKFT